MALFHLLSEEHSRGLYELYFDIGGVGVLTFGEDGHDKTDKVALRDYGHGAGDDELIVAVEGRDIALAALTKVEDTVFGNGFGIGGELFIEALLLGKSGICDYGIAVAD